MLFNDCQARSLLYHSVCLYIFVNFKQKTFAHLMVILFKTVPVWKLTIFSSTLPTLLGENVSKFKWYPDNYESPTKQVTTRKTPKNCCCCPSSGKANHKISSQCTGYHGKQTKNNMCSVNRAGDMHMWEAAVLWAA